MLEGGLVRERYHEGIVTGYLESKGFFVSGVKLTWASGF